nr:BFH_HP1_G0048760.mRNA.1.CDS.1 [Saccharomyces cerevisiae]
MEWEMWLVWYTLKRWNFDKFSDDTLLLLMIQLPIILSTTTLRCSLENHEELSLLRKGEDEPYVKVLRS